MEDFVDETIWTYVSEVGGSETNREIVSVRSHACTRGLVLRSELGKKRLAVPFPFSLLDQEGNSSEFCGVLVGPSEI